MSKIRWTTEELEIIEENHDKMSMDELVELLPGRSKKSVQRKVEKMQLAGELDYKYYSKHSREQKDERNDLWED